MSADQSKFLYAVERAFSVAVGSLWHAWAEPAALEQWYSPTVLKVVPGSVVNEVRVGGPWSVAVDVSSFGQPDACFYGRYSEVVTYRLMVHSMHYTTDAAEFEAKDESTASHTVVVEFEDRGDGQSWCKFSQYGEMQAEQIPRTQEGMTSYFDNLQAFLATTLV
ncbi:MAG: hypothetical protein RLZ28_182 [Actinomycetota bacterium]|jgi:uncharacterized protein YndB with AHSA1/START domain